MTDAIYTVTTLHFYDPQYGSSPRTVGWFQDLETALSCVRENWGDIRETTYDYAVVERVTPGLYTMDDRDERWFHWEEGSYQECKKPKRLTGVCFFSMG